MKLNISTHWTVVGSLPEIEPNDCYDHELSQLTEDLIQIRSQNQELCLDVGFFPEGSRNGQYICQLILKDNWENPVEIFYTRLTDQVVLWINNSTLKLF